MRPPPSGVKRQAVAAVIPIDRGRARRPGKSKVIPMPVSRSHIVPFATNDSQQFQALTDLANFADALEKAIGMRVGAGAGTGGPPAPSPADWNVSASNGHFLIQIVEPVSGAAQPPQQHQIASALSADFGDAASVTTYTLGLGEITRDLVDPGVAKYWRLRSRYPGSSWNAWRLYATSAGVVALASGALKTS